MLINLDPWLQLDKWGNTTAKGVEVIDKCLNPNIEMAKSPQGKRNITPRKRSVLPARYKEYIVDKPSAYCPKCSVYVSERDDGVVCAPCEAYWHYTCAGVTQEELDGKWRNVNYLCPKHNMREEEGDSIDSVDSDSIDEAMPEKDNNIKVTNIKINNYALNAQLKIKEKLSRMDTGFKIEPKDHDRQYYLLMSTPTYHIIIENIIEFGDNLGLNVRRHDADMSGQMVQAQFFLDIRATDDMTTSVSLTGYHTKNSILVQLLGTTTARKLSYLSNFVNGTLAKIIQKVEKSNAHDTVKDMLIDYFQNAKKGKTLPTDIMVPNVIEMGHLEKLSLTEKVVTNEDTIMNDEKSQAEVIMPLKLCDSSTEKIIDKSRKASDTTSTERSDAVDIHETSGSCNQVSDTLITDLKIKLEAEGKERKKVNKEMVSLQKQLKDSEAKAKMNTTLEDKLEKMTKLKNQMDAAVEALKLENEVLKQENKGLLEQQKEVGVTHSSIVTSFEEKLVEKEEVIREQAALIKKQEIGNNLHRELAYKFMEIADEEDVADKQNDVTTAHELKKIYEQLTKEESKTTELRKEIDHMKADNLKLQSMLDENNMSAKEMQEKHEKELQSQKTVTAEMENNNKKEIKMLKDALNTSEGSRGTLSATIKTLEGEIKDYQTNQKVQEVVTSTHNIEKGVITQLEETVKGLKCSLELERAKKEEKEQELRNVLISTEENVQKMEKELATKEQKIKETMELLKNEETRVNDITESYQFVESSLGEKSTEVEMLKLKLKEQQKESLNMSKNYDVLSLRQKENQKETAELQVAYASCRNQIEQLLYLNNQLKSKADLFEQQITDHVCKKNDSIEVSDQTDNSNSRQISLRAENESYDVLKEIQRYCYAEI